MDNPTASTENPAPPKREDVRAQLEAHEKALAALSAERAQLTKQLESLKSAKQVLEAVARKLAKTQATTDAP